MDNIGMYFWEITLDVMLCIKKIGLCTFTIKKSLSSCTKLNDSIIFIFTYSILRNILKNHILVSENLTISYF